MYNDGYEYKALVDTRSPVCFFPQSFGRKSREHFVTLSGQTLITYAPFMHEVNFGNLLYDCMFYGAVSDYWG